MKYSDLQIGDYVKYQGHIYIIEEISAKGWVHLINPETKTRVNVTSDYIIGLLEPIPLTKEILEANGFTHHIQRIELSNICYIKKDLYSIFIYDFRHCIITNVLTDASCDVYLSHVHELQHALRLCRLDDLVDNFKVEEYI